MHVTCMSHACLREYCAVVGVGRGTSSLLSGGEAWHGGIGREGGRLRTTQVVQTLAGGLSLTYKHQIPSINLYSEIKNEGHSIFNFCPLYFHVCSMVEI